MSERLTGDFRKFMDKNFLGSWDVPPTGDLILTIDHAARDDVQNDRGREKKLTIHFKEDGFKPMICNTTNAKAISKAHGSTLVEDWAGKKISIYKATISAFGQTQECLRVRDYAPKEETAICEQMGKDKVKRHMDTGAEYITGPDCSCLMHMAGVAKKQNLPIQFKHAVEILAEGL